MSRVCRWLLATLWLALTTWAALQPAQAHEISMAELQLRELQHGRFLIQWGAGEKRAPAEVLGVDWPDGCRQDNGYAECGEDGLKGELAIRGVGRDFSVVVLKVHWRRGGTTVHTLTEAQPTVQLFGSAHDERGLAEVARSYTVLGFEHILSGIDHLAFVMGLLFLVGFQRRLIWTITAFTLAHSLTLGLSALGWLQLRPAPVEATIALSIMLVAGEALHQRHTWSRRWPALVAFGFGLIHGLGFAGALREFGLPQQHLLGALLSFNLGVEAGQLMVVGVAWALWRTLREQRLFQRLRTPALYLIGCTAAFWTVSRVAALGG